MNNSILAKLPNGFKELRAGSLYANSDPLLGGIIDQNRVSGKFFVIFNRCDVKSVEEIDTLEEAVEVFCRKMT